MRWLRSLEHVFPVVTTSISLKKYFHLYLFEHHGQPLKTNSLFFSLWPSPFPLYASSFSILVWFGFFPPLQEAGFLWAVITDKLTGTIPAAKGFSLLLYPPHECFYSPWSYSFPATLCLLPLFFLSDPVQWTWRIIGLHPTFSEVFTHHLEKKSPSVLFTRAMNVGLTPNLVELR